MDISETDTKTAPGKRMIIRLLILLVLCFLLLWISLSILQSERVSERVGSVCIDGGAAIAMTDDDFICATLDWWPPDKCDYGTCSWGRAGILNLDLSNPILLNAVKAFSPLKVRIGGTLQDRAIYEVEANGIQGACSEFIKDSPLLLGFSQGCLSMSRWDELNTFFQKAGAIVTFGLNALYQRAIASDGSAKGPWNSSNAESLIRYTVNKGYNISGWELGNELSGNGTGARIAADQYAADLNSLRNMVLDIYRGLEAKPLVLAPGGFFDANWFTEFIDNTTQSLQVVTHHIYNLGPGVDDHLVKKILDPSYLDSGSHPFRSLQSILKNSETTAVAWVGEAGGVFNSGKNHVTNTFVFSFWYLDQLGMASSYDTKTYCRQTLIGGNYGLLNTDTFVPNPDYYSALLWHRLMGSKVLKTTFSGTGKIRAYTHCSKSSRGITLLLINLNGKCRFQVHVSTGNDSSNGTLTLQQDHPSLGENVTTISRSSKIANDEREEYHLTAKDGDLHSQTMLLNGKELSINSSGLIPPLEPTNMRMSAPITIEPFSIVFAQFPSIDVTACT